MVWPVNNTGAWLASVLQDVVSKSHQAGGYQEVVDSYLKWVNNSLVPLQPLLSAKDLDRLITTPRYWAINANPVGTPATQNAVGNEVQHQKRLLEATQAAVEEVVDAWKPADFDTTYVVFDTNFWMDHNQSYKDTDWHGFIRDRDGNWLMLPTAELRIVVPMLVIDELDEISHRGDSRGTKARAAVRALYPLLDDGPGLKRPLKPGDRTTTGDVNVQLLLDPLTHRRLPNNDDELVDRLQTLRDFLGHPAHRFWFLSQDGGACFRAATTGLTVRRLPKPDTSQGSK